MWEGLRKKIADLLENEKEKILDEYSRNLISHLTTQRKEKIIPKRLITGALRKRFRDILERQICYLRTGDYDVSSSMEDVDFADYVIPQPSQDLKSHTVTVALELFINTIAEQIFNKLKFDSYISYSHITPLLNKLIYLAYEDLWITSIVGFKRQQATIRKLLLKAMKAHEEERKVLAIELHDGVLPLLATALIRIDILKKLLAKGKEKKLKKELLCLKQFIESVIQKIRNLNFDLHPVWITNQGLIPALDTYIKDFQSENEILVNLSISPSFDGLKLGRDLEVNLFRIIQELMTNVKKHANAKRIQIAMAITDGYLCISVEDDGIGFDLPKVLSSLHSSKSFGLISVRERTKLYGGTMKIQTSIGHGTKVEIAIPVSHEKV